VLHQRLIPAVQKTLPKPRQQVEPPVHLAQQKRSSVGTDRPAIETGYDFPPPRPFKSEARLVTLCHSEGRPFLALTVVWKLSYATEVGLLPIQREKCGLIQARTFHAKTQRCKDAKQKQAGNAHGFLCVFAPWRALREIF
jgi:hypothetical protein